jgi:Terminase large subunit, T4likevirus-type, N-terminal
MFLFLVWNQRSWPIGALIGRFRVVGFGMPFVFKPGGTRLATRVPETHPDAVLFAQERLGLTPDDPQCEVLRSTAKRGILNCTRQWGKSTVAAAKALHRAFTTPKCLVLVASPGERQSAEWMRKAGDMLERTGAPRRGDGDNSISLLLPNRSRIVGLPGTEATVRGFSAVSMLLIDEASRVEEPMYKALRPMLAVGDGDMWLMSTPNGKKGFFYDSWEHGGDRWMRVRVTAPECPRISKEFLEEQRSTMGDAWFRQEHLCEFVDGTVGVFEREVVERAIRDDIEPLWE